MQSEDTPAPSVDGLIARLEEAGRGSRQLDWAIHGAPAPPPPAYDWSNVPAYTTSVDTALALVAPAWRVYALQEEYVNPPGAWFAGLDHRTQHYLRGSKMGKGATAALALCIAALRAPVRATARACEPKHSVEHRCRARPYTGVNMTKLEQALSEIKRRAVRTDLLVWGPGSVGVEPVTCICITEDALREALKEVYGKASVLDPEPSQYTP